MKNRFLLGMTYLIALNFELAIFLVGGVYGARFLNKNHPISFDWLNATIPISVLLCCFAVYRYLVFIVKSDQKKAKGGD